MRQEKENNFGSRFHEAFRGASQTEIAQRLGMSNSAITNYAEGRIPPAETLVKISSLTGYSIHWLITGDGVKKVLGRDGTEGSNAQTIMLVNEKGGSAKSTSAVIISIELAKRGYRVLVVDSSSGDCAFGLFAPILGRLFWQYTSLTGKTNRRSPKKRMFFKTEIPGLHLCTTHHKSLLMLTDQGFKGFSTNPEAINKDYDFIVLDTDSAISPLESLNPFTSALINSAHVLMPVYAHPLSLRAAESTLKNMQDALQSTGDINFLGAFLTVFISTWETSLMMVDELNKVLPGKVLKTMIHENEEVAGLASYSPIQLTSSASPAAAEYSPLVDEVLNLLGRIPEQDRARD